MLTELKARAVYLGAREIGERMGPKTTLQIKEGVTLESIQRLEATKRFDELASDYYSVFQIESDPERRAWVLIELVQQLINLGSFGQARREFLPRVSMVTRELRGHLLATIKAKYEEKLAWIADYEFGYPDELVHLSRAREYLEYIPQVYWEDEHKRIKGTLDHFTGRAYYGMAAQGVDTVKNISEALSFFQRDLERARGLRRDGRPNPVNEAFQHLRMTACYILVRNGLQAYDHLRQAQVLAEEEEERRGKKGIMAHCHLARGWLKVAEGDLVAAESEFSLAVEIRQSQEPYPKGLSDAKIGLAVVELKKGNLVMAGINLKEALQNYPINILWLVSNGLSLRQ